MKNILPFEDIGKGDLNSAGGKGVNLGEMVGAGFPVPAGFVLTTAAYDAFVEVNELRGPILEAAQGVGLGDHAAAEAASVEIQQMIQFGEVPQDTASELAAAYSELGAGPAAVRSSATAEDLPGASFAGQQETFLNVDGEEALLEAVKCCWASLWTARAIAYRERIGIESTAVSMAVVIQNMVQAEVSGILFTANPTTGARDELLINASYGLGEAIVSGQVTPDSHLLDRDDLQVKESTLGEKELMIVSSSVEGTISQSVPGQLRGLAALGPAQLKTLAEFGLQVEAHFDGVPQDIEWAIAGQDFWLLQARPITNLPPAPLKDVVWEPIRPSSVWMRRQVVEHMPEPLSPLFDELYLQEGLDASMQSMADFMSEISGLEINIWELIQPPFTTSYNGYAYSLASFEFSPGMVPYVMRIYVQVLPKMIRHLFPRWIGHAVPAYQEMIATWGKVDLTATRDEELLMGIRELAHQDAIYWFEAAVPLGLARMSDSALGLLLKIALRGSGPDGQIPNSGSYLWGFPSKAVDAQIQLEAMARQIDKRASLRNKVLKTPAARLLQVLQEDEDGQEVLADLHAYLNSYGHQIYNLDFAAPTLADDPMPVLLSLKTAVTHPEQDAKARQAEMARERDVLTAQTEQMLNPIIRPIFKLLLGWAQRYVPFREEALFYVGAAWPALRRLAHELGRRLVEAGSLHDMDDVFFLRTSELAEASAAREKGEARVDLADLAGERRVLREARRRLDPPSAVPPDGRMMFGPIDMAFLEPKPREASTGPTLGGFAVSPGVVTAPASVIRSPEDFHKMVPDTILVCTTTTPAWTPLFANAKGLVTDIGGALAHGSIVAREYGIPAVMGTGAATQRINDGQIIRVDGSSGVVTLVDEVDTAVSDEIMEKGISKKKVAIIATAVGAVIGLFFWLRKKK